MSYGAPEKPSRAFQTLKKLDSNGNPTSEEFHYEYDSMGRLTNAAFMQTPQTGQTGYSSTYPAAVRARVYYNYDVSGVMTNIEHYWDTWNSSTQKYASVPILGAVCSYDPYKLLKARVSHFLNKFRTQGFIDYVRDGALTVHSGLLDVVLSG